MKLEHHLKHIESKFCKMEQRERNLTEALNLALDILQPMESGDSRAVSDEYVAMASVFCGIEDDKSMAVIRKRLEYYKELAINERAKYDVGFPVEISTGTFES